MKKILMIVGILVFPMCVNAATVTAYTAVYCNGSYSTSAERTMCTNAGYSCGSNGAYLPHVTSGGTYKSYQSCVRAYAGSGDAQSEYPYIFCFTNSEPCHAIKNGCYSEYYGTQPAISLTEVGSVGGLSYISNTAQFECCYNGGCTGYDDTTNISGNSSGAVLYRKPYSCNASGTCASTTTGAYITCNTGFYSSTGLSKYALPATGNASNPANNTSRLVCTKCSTATGYDDATTDGYGKTAITQCLLPTGYSDCDDSGCFTYKSSCYYTK